MKNKKKKQSKIKAKCLDICMLEEIFRYGKRFIQPVFSGASHRVPRGKQHDLQDVVVAARLRPDRGQRGVRQPPAPPRLTRRLPMPHAGQTFFDEPIGQIFKICSKLRNMY